MTTTSDEALGSYIIRSLLDSLPDLGVHSIANINDRSSLLENAKRLDKWGRKALCRSTDVKVLE